MVRIGLLPFLRLVIFWILGILIAQLSGGHHWLTPCIAVAISLLLLLFFHFKWVSLKPSHHWLKAGLVGILFVALSWVNVVVSQPQNQPDHFLKLPAERVIIKLTEQPVQKRKTKKALGIITHSISANTQYNASGKVLVYFLDSIDPLLNTGDYLICLASEIQNIGGPTNPGQFDYRAYLKNKGIEHQTFLHQNAFVVLEKNQNLSFQQLVTACRKSLLNGLSFLNEETRAVAEALLLGQKDHLSSDTRESFSSTGTMHILAVSGLHVGIIYLLLQKFLLLLSGRGRVRVLRLFLVLAGLWSYAILTGLPPSVQRASFMFSMIAIGAQLKRPNSILNNVLVSAFVLLVIDPNLLYQVGFQLSYAAVLGIILLHPYILNWIRVDVPVLNYLWSLTAVSIAAQIATLPITLFYFNQFPIIFPISNFIAIPGAFLVVAGGILLEILTPFGGFVLEGYQWLYQALLDIMVGLISRLGALPYSNIDRLILDSWDVAVLYFSTIWISYGLIVRSPRWIIIGLCVLCLQQATHWGERIWVWPKAELVVFDTRGSSVYGFKGGNQGFLIYSDSLHKDFDFQISGFFKDQAYQKIVNDRKFALPIPSFGLNSELLLFEKTRISLSPVDSSKMAAFQYFVLNKTDTWDKLNHLPAESCVFDASVKPEWVLNKYPKFASSHFVQRDGAFTIQFQ